MSHRSGDRARADKQTTKRRLRRSLLRPLTKAINAAKPKVIAPPKESPAEA